MEGVIITNGTAALNIPAVLRATWTSIPIPIDAAASFAEGSISWVEDAPAGTTVKVFARVGGSAQFLPITNGAGLPVLFPGQNLRGQTITLLVNLETTDGNVTPTVSALTIMVNGANFPVIPMSGLADKFIDSLNSPFSADPEPRLALRLTYDGAMTWRVQNYTLTTAVEGGIGGPLNAFLPMFTLGELVEYLNAQPGYSVLYVDEALNDKAAVCLLDAAGDIDTSNGDHLYAYSATLREYFSAVAFETQLAADAVSEMLRYMDMREAEGEWLDYWGAFFDVTRRDGETDESLAPRITSDPFRFRCNNLAIENYVRDETGVGIRIYDLDWEDTNFITTNPAPVVYRGTSRFVEITNDGAYVTAPFVADSAKKQLLARFGITLFATGDVSGGGYPYWGNPANDNPLVCAFAVVLGSSTLTLEQKEAIRDAVNRAKMAGTMALFFEPLKVLHSNTAGESTNSEYVAAPGTAAYSPVIWPES
ncbi:MAG TPA: hypothetical protein VFL54_09910 [Gammaproteobacteria bacterium]|nr:hypothetical protein [Gammaproteobacteria bacterium]